MHDIEISNNENFKLESVTNSELNLINLKPLILNKGNQIINTKITVNLDPNYILIVNLSSLLQSQNIILINHILKEKSIDIKIYCQRELFLIPQILTKLYVLTLTPINIYLISPINKIQPNADKACPNGDGDINTTATGPRVLTTVSSDS